MAATVWKGHISFGLVSIPVRLIRAARPERVKLRQLFRSPPPPAPEAEYPSEDIHRAPEGKQAFSTARSARPAQPELEPEPAVSPVRRAYQDATGSNERPIERADLVKGYEYEKGQYVVLNDEDLRSLAPQTSSQMEIVQFVNFADIDPIFLETSYYLAPDRNGELAYALLFEAMRKTGYAAVGQLTMHRRDHVLILRPGRSGLIAHTMFYADEVRSMDEFRTDISLIQAKELALAQNLIQAMTRRFEPGQFKNAFQERMRELIESRAAGRQVAKVEQPSRAPVIDIMAALQSSLAAAKSAAPSEAPKEQATTARRKPAAEEQGKRNRRAMVGKRK